MRLLAENKDGMVCIQIREYKVFACYRRLPSCHYHRLTLYLVLVTRNLLFLSLLISMESNLPMTRLSNGSKVLSLVPIRLF